MKGWGEKVGDKASYTEASLLIMWSKCWDRYLAALTPLALPSSFKSWLVTRITSFFCMGLKKTVPSHTLDKQTLDTTSLRKTNTRHEKPLTNKHYTTNPGHKHYLWPMLCLTLMFVLCFRFVVSCVYLSRVCYSRYS